MNNREYDPELVTKFFKEYEDRGTMKWQGFYLSDHTVAIAKEENQLDKNIKRSHSKQMNEFEIQQVINKAIEKHFEVEIEMGELNSEELISEPIIGRIIGYYENQLIVNNKYVNINNIYAIKKATSN